VSVDISLT